MDLARVVKTIQTTAGHPPLKIKVLNKLEPYQIDAVVRQVADSEQLSYLKRIQQEFTELDSLFVAHGGGNPADSHGLGWRYIDIAGQPKLVYKTIGGETGQQPALALICDNVLKGDFSYPLETAKIVFPAENTYRPGFKAVIPEKGGIRVRWMPRESDEFLNYLTTHNLQLDSNGRLQNR